MYNVCIGHMALLEAVYTTYARALRGGPGGLAQP